MSEKILKGVFFSFLLVLAGQKPAAAQAGAVPDAAAEELVPLEHPLPLPPKAPELKIEILYLDKAIAEVSRDTATLPVLYNTVKEIYLKQAKMDKAISLLNTYFSNRGTDIGVLSSLAYLYEQKGAAAKAAEVYEAIVRLDHENAPFFRSRLVDIYLQQGNTNKALSLAESLARLNPVNPYYLRLLGRAQQAANDWKAIETTKKVIQLDPQAGDYQRLAELYVKEKKYDEAVAALEEGMKKLPKDAVPLGILIGDIHTRSGDYDKALRVLNDLMWKTNVPDVKNNIKAAISLAEKLKTPPVSTAVPVSTTPPVAVNP
ncbi:MAG: hypothetical protein COT18_05470 [Elusimicrobia bacterium CG08_land_8_20_14_0_20_59_10]|nr:MAG: hypothetical protein COT18_05470 [Elusimicrobia bacterium CG08_land_8_20_14_0_20_59_10]